MGAKSRTKGKVAEREVINAIQAQLDKAHKSLVEFGYSLGEPVVLERNLIQAHSGGCDMHGLDWIAVEIKRQEVLQLEAWWLQCLRQAKKGQIPVLIYRQSFKAWRVRLPGELLIEETSRIALKCVCEVSFEDFLNWFQRRAMRELARTGFKP